MFRLITATLGVLTGLLLAGPASGADRDAIKRGKQLSQIHCARCHVIGDFNRNGGISSTPSFQLLVKALKDYEERFSTFYARPPHPAVIAITGIDKRDDLPFNAAPVTLTLDNVKDILAFARTLKPKNK